MTDFSTVIIIGAARSGTNILRDIVCSFEEFDTWPADEINPIWKYGNTFRYSDVLVASDATKDVRSYIQRSFKKQWLKANRPRFLVEKTCANALRMDFVFSIFPDAKFIILVRNGLDVIPSAMRRWSGILEVSAGDYLYSKSKFVPLLSLPFYIFQFIYRRLFLKLYSRYPSWGPKFDGLVVNKSDTLVNICARQWATSVMRVEDFLPNIPPSNIHRIRYEDLIAGPHIAISDLLKFLGADVKEENIKNAIKMIRRSSNISNVSDIPGLDVSIISSAMNRLGYDLGEL